MIKNTADISYRYHLAFTNRYLIYFMFFSLLGFIIYFPSFSVGFLSDDYFSINLFREKGIHVLLYEGCKIFMPLMLLVFGVLFKIFGLHPLGYHVFILLLHVLNAVMLVIFTENYLNILKLLQGRTLLPAFLAGLLFLVNPYQTEAITWISSIGYPLSVVFYLSCLLVFLQWMQQSKIWLFLLSGLLFFLAILAKEVSLSLPAILLVILIFSHLKNGKEWNVSFLYKIVWVLVFYCILIIIYFFLRNMVIGEFIGHYGKDIHLNFAPYRLLQGLIAYTAKFFLLYRFLPETCIGVITFFRQHIFVFIGLIALLLMVVYYFRKPFKEWLYMPAVQLSLLFLICFYFALFVVLNLELSSLGEIQSDRYGYFASVFFSLSVVFIIVAISERNMKFSLVLLLPILWFAFLTRGENHKWVHSSEISENFYRSMTTKDLTGKRIYLVNVPDRYKGAYVLRSCINEGLQVKNICKSCRVSVLSFMEINNDSDRILYTRGKNFVELRTSGSGIKFLPCERYLCYPGFTFYCTSENYLKIRFAGELPSKASLFFIAQDGTISYYY
jgi:protein O-mannosyl-transferase